MRQNIGIRSFFKIESLRSSYKVFEVIISPVSSGSFCAIDCALLSPLTVSALLQISVRTKQMLTPPKKIIVDVIFFCKIVESFQGVNMFSFFFCLFSCRNHCFPPQGF